MKVIFSASVSRFLYPLCLSFCCLVSCCRNPCSNREIRERHAEMDIEAIEETIDLPTRPLSLCDIIEIAWERNYDLLVKQQELAVQREFATSEALKMLPPVVFNGEWSARNQNLASTSLFLTTCRDQLPSTSAEQKVRRWDITGTFSLLNFAVNFFRSKSEEYLTTSICYQYERLSQNLVLDIFRSYWRAIAARKAADGSIAVINLAKQLQVIFNKQIALRNVSEIEGLKLEDRFLAVRINLDSYERTYQSAKAELAGFMGLPLSVNFELADVNIDPNINVALLSVEELEQMALLNRPELYSSDAEEAASRDKVFAAFVQLFPDLDLFSGHNTNLDRFLVHHQWIVTGIRLAWDFMAVPWHIYDTRAAKAKRLRDFDERLAISIGVMVQVRLAYLKYLDALSLYHLHLEVQEVRERLLTAANLEYVNGEYTEIDIFQYQSDALEGEILTAQAYAELQIALELLNNAVGLPLLFNYLPECWEARKEMEPYNES